MIGDDFWVYVQYYCYFGVFEIEKDDDALAMTMYVPFKFVNYVAKLIKQNLEA